MSYNMKITVPPKKTKHDHRSEGNPKLRDAGKRRAAFFQQAEYLELGPQKAQSPIKEWAEFTPAEKRALLERLGVG